uniref:AlNc14C250G9638 protein n=1 Tax=Albugo laibachii Nc14 TaxID=890382 RepID=F0WTF9_9STRA|nr:AlNc14C250G9638 [Albugo laibachii Nc14]|eukprot:CCA24649.1 AlNc14C250G9638 [Albugo laibachii Nc14]
MRKRAFRFIRPRSGIVRAHMTCEKKIWSLAHQLKLKDYNNADTEQVSMFMPTSRHLRQLQLPIFEDLQFQLSFRILLVSHSTLVLEGYAP